MGVYFDTSAFAKRYVAEPMSEALDRLVGSLDGDCVICPLVATEFESILQRLLRQGLIDKAYVSQARLDFSADLAGALWAMRPFEAGSFHRATQLIRDLGVPLATLDALHLASALELGCGAFATADRQLARAAQASGLVVHPFS